MIRRWSAAWTAVSQSFFSGAKALTVPLTAVHHWNLHDLSVDAAPAEFSAMAERFFSG